MLWRLVIISSMIVLSACSIKPTTSLIYEEPPKFSLENPCYAEHPIGKSGEEYFRHLHAAYIHNLGCIKKYENLLDAQRVYFNERRDILLQK